MKRGQEDIQDLVDSPNETLLVEYKSIINIDDGKSKADLARHIAALSNSGGGKIVLGFNDDLTLSIEKQTAFGRDDIASLTKHYLSPSPHCDVVKATSKRGNDHLIIIVPPHGDVPICACADGPQIEKRVQGIRKGVYYIRKAGPESAPIEGASEWLPLIRRLVAAERVSILSAIDAALSGTRPQADPLAPLDEWRMAARQSYEAARNARSLKSMGYFQLSYQIRPFIGGPQHAELKATLESVRNAVDQEVYSGWGMLHIFHGAVEHRFVTDPKVASGEADFLETNFLRDGSTTGADDLWRASTTGMVTILRGYIEDSATWGQTFGPPQTAISVDWLVQNTAEIVSHARHFATRFPEANTIDFVAEWNGLAGRRIVGRGAGIRMRGHALQEERRISRVSATLGEVENRKHSVILELLAPLLRAGGLENVVDEAWIRQDEPSWSRL